jgi:hypothetical protein
VATTIRRIRKIEWHPHVVARIPLRAIRRLMKGHGRRVGPPRPNAALDFGPALALDGLFADANPVLRAAHNIPADVALGNICPMHGAARELRRR